MTKTTKDQPASLANFASFPVSPWVWLTIIAFGVTAYKGWNAEVTGLAVLTPEWFMPMGAIAAAVGIVLTGTLIARREAAAFGFLALAVMVFLPIVMLGMLQMTGSTVLPASVKTVWGVLFVVAPWIAAGAAWDDNRTCLERPA
jgi:hypothetical protein